MYYVRGDEEALKEVCTGPMFMVRTCAGVPCAG